jgi:dihydroxyacetone kinase-like protein
MTLSPMQLRALIDNVTSAVIAHADELTALDSAIGDADHGINMKRGAEAVRAEIDMIADKPLGEALKAIGTKLVMTVGGASGPLYGTLAMSLGKEIDAHPLPVALASATDAVAARGKSGVGQKTMLDVLYSAVEALRNGKTADELPSVLDAAAEATIPMRALRGRASFLGERSIGHMDPGARSTALIATTIIKTLESTS